MLCIYAARVRRLVATTDKTCSIKCVHEVICIGWWLIVVAISSWVVAGCGHNLYMHVMYSVVWLVPKWLYILFEQWRSVEIWGAMLIVNSVMLTTFLFVKIQKGEEKSQENLRKRKLLTKRKQEKAKKVILSWDALYYVHHCALV